MAFPDRSLEIDPERPFSWLRQNETKDLRTEKCRKTGFPDRSLEDVPNRYHGTTGVAVEHLIPFLESRIAGDEETAIGAEGRIRPYRIEVSWKVLRVIEYISEITTQFQRLTFAD